MADAPFVSLTGRYFQKKRDLANGIAFSGTSLGVLTIPLFLKWAIDEYTVRGALLLLGGLWLHTVVVAAIMRPLPKEKLVKGPYYITADAGDGAMCRPRG